MKKTIAILAAAIVLSVSFSSCRKLMCQCEAIGSGSQAHVQEVLDRHISDCVTIADQEGYIIDSGVTVKCSY